MRATGTEMELPVMTDIEASTSPTSPAISASISPDMRKVFYSAPGNEPQNSDICEYNLETKLVSNITFGSGLNAAPCWSPDGKLVAFSSGPDVYIKNADGTGDKELVYKNDSAYYKNTDDWSSDGTKLLINDIVPRTGFELVIVDVRNRTAARYLTSGNSTLINAKFSHDMKWVLFTSNQSGVNQLYVRPLNSNQTGMWQVSTEGGISGWWVNNDKAIIYATTDGKVFKVTVNSSGNSFVVGSSQHLFSLTDKNISGLSDVSKDGTEFLGSRPVGKAAIPPLTYVQNWKGLITKGEQ